MKSSDGNRLRVWLELGQLGLFLTGLCLLASLVVICGISLFFVLEEPRGVAIRVFRDTQRATLIEPQPVRILPGDTNTCIVKPAAIGGYFSGATTLATTWANGRHFNSGTAAAAELVSASGPLWLLDIMALGGAWLSNRVCRRLNRKSSH